MLFPSLHQSIEYLSFGDNGWGNQGFVPMFGRIVITFSFPDQAFHLFPPLLHLLQLLIVVRLEGFFVLPFRFAFRHISFLKVRMSG
jgi:hypothetical protein